MCNAVFDLEFAAGGHTHLLQHMPRITVLSFPRIPSPQVIRQFLILLVIVPDHTAPSKCTIKVAGRMSYEIDCT